MTIEKVLELAIRLEVESERMYRDAARATETPGARALLTELAEEEVLHRQMLEGVRTSGDQERIGAGPAPADLRTADYLVDPPVTAESTTQDLLLFAIKREQSATDLYARMTQIYAGTTAVPVLERLVLEETQHKVRLEREYDEYVQNNN
jgi:rubrerythrin